MRIASGMLWLLLLLGLAACVPSPVVSTVEQAEPYGSTPETPGAMNTTALYMTSLNEVIDRHTERLVAEQGFRVPPIVVNGLYIVAVLTMMFVGVQNSYRERHNMIAEIIVVLILSGVFLLIVDLDRSHLGIMKIPQEALIDLQQKLISAP